MPRPAGTYFLTPTITLHVFESSLPGPTALIQAGIHGDEIAGVHALQELLEDGIEVSHGRLLVCPVMNPAAYRQKQRAAEGGLDLNRCFPGDANSTAKENRLARLFMDLVLDERPDLIATLHESHKRFDPAVVPSFGQSLVYGVKPIPPLVERTVDRLNEYYRGPQEHWVSQHYPVATSSTEVIVDAIGCVGVCVETWMGFDERIRIDMQKKVVEFMLADLGIRRNSESS